MPEGNGELPSTVTQATTPSLGQRVKQALHLGPKKHAPLFHVFSQPEPGKKPLIPLSKKALPSEPLDEEILKAMDH